MTELRLALLGFGHVGQAFVKLLTRKIEAIARYNVTIKLVGVATKDHGIALNPGGIDPGQLLAASIAGQSLEQFSAVPDSADPLEFIQKLETDILLETITLNPQTGQPAVEYIQTALQKGFYIITTNKSGPAFAYRQLMTLAEQQKRAFLFEGAVLDGAPLFSLVRETLPATEILGFRGVVNSTTNFILTAMEEGLLLEDALRQAQALGIAEKNPDDDLEGWDAAAKTAILVNAFMGGDITPTQINRTGIGQLTTRTIIDAVRQGRRFKLIAEAHRRDGAIVARVTPRMLPLSDPLAHVTGSAAAVTLDTDTLGEITLYLHEGEVSQTAYAALADLITIIKTYVK